MVLALGQHEGEDGAKWVWKSLKTSLYMHFKAHRHKSFCMNTSNGKHFLLSVAKQNGFGVKKQLKYLYI
jgi:hypothetical protein